MADDPYAKYLAPPASAPGSDGSDPYSKYLTPPSSGPSATPSVGYGEAIARTLAEGAGGGLGDVLLGAAGSSGAGDSLPTISSQRARTQAGEDQLGWMRYPVEAIGVGAGLLTGTGEAGWALRGAGAAGDVARGLGYGEKAASMASNAVKGAAEAGGYGAVSGAAHSDSLDPGTILGNAASGAASGAALGGVVGGALGSGYKLGAKGAPAKSIDTLQAEKDALYGGLEKIPVAADDFRGAIGDAYNQLKPGELSGISPQFRDQLARIVNIGDRTSLSANDVESMQRQLWGVAKRQFAPTDTMAAGKISDSLDGLLGDVGASDAVDAAKTAHARLSDAQELPWLTVNSAPKWAQDRLNDPTMRYGDAERTALQKLADYAKSPAPTGFLDTLKSQVGQTMTDKGLGYFGALGAHMGPFGALGVPLLQGVGKAGLQAWNANSIQKALDDAGATLTTGTLTSRGDGAIKRMLGDPKTRDAAIRVLQAGLN